MNCLQIYHLDLRPKRMYRYWNCSKPSCFSDKLAICKQYKPRLDCFWRSLMRSTLFTVEPSILWSQMHKNVISAGKIWNEMFENLGYVLNMYASIYQKKKKKVLIFLCPPPAFGRSGAYSVSPWCYTRTCVCAYVMLVTRFKFTCKFRCKFTSTFIMQLITFIPSGLESWNFVWHLPTSRPFNVWYRCR